MDMQKLCNGHNKLIKPGNYFNSLLPLLVPEHCSVINLMTSIARFSGTLTNQPKRSCTNNRNTYAPRMETAIICHQSLKTPLTYSETFKYLHRTCYSSIYSKVSNSCCLIPSQSCRILSIAKAYLLFTTFHYHMNSCHFTKRYCLLLWFLMLGPESAGLMRCKFGCQCHTWTELWNKE
jgi:hypothetical protein